MELTITLNHGPLEAEFTGDDREEIQKELLKFNQFLKNNEGEFNIESVAATDSENGTEQARLDTVTEEDEVANQADSDLEEALSPVARSTGIPESKLSRVLYVDPEGKKDPEILIDNPDEIFDSTQKGKQKPGSLILLYLWKNCYEDKDEVHSSELKDALAGSGIDPSSLFNIYDKDINQKGSSNRLLELSRSGQLQAQDEIEKLVEQVVGES